MRDETKMKRTLNAELRTLNHLEVRSSMFDVRRSSIRLSCGGEGEVGCGVDAFDDVARGSQGFDFEEYLQLAGADGFDGGDERRCEEFENAAETSGGVAVQLGEDLRAHGGVHGAEGFDELVELGEDHVAVEGFSAGFVLGLLAAAEGDEAGEGGFVEGIPAADLVGVARDVCVVEVLFVGHHQAELVAEGVDLVDVHRAGVDGGDAVFGGGRAVR